MSKYDAVLPAQTAAAADSITVDAVIETSDDLENILVTALLIPPAGFTTVTGQATNNATISVRQLRAGAVIATPAGGHPRGRHEPGRRDPVDGADRGRVDVAVR